LEEKAKDQGQLLEEERVEEARAQPVHLPMPAVGAAVRVAQLRARRQLPVEVMKEVRHLLPLLPPLHQAEEEV